MKTRRRAMKRLIRSAATGAALVLAGPAFAACGVSNTDDSIGPQSPAAVKGGAVPYTPVDAGFGCTSSAVVSLLSGDTMTASLAANASLLLTSTDGKTSIPYSLSGSPNDTGKMTAGGSLGSSGLTILALGGNKTNVKLYVKPTSADFVAPGSYSGTIDISWSWRFCSTIWAAGLCTLGVIDSGSGTAKVKITLTVEQKPATMQITTETTWDTVSGTNKPRALPGSKLRLSVTVTNPDIVALDLDTLKIVLPTMPTSVVALDGDGKNSGSAIKSADGSPASKLLFNYTNPADQNDDVDFSSDNGTNWTFAPTPGDGVSQELVTRIRFRPKGSMAPLSSFTMSIPYTVK